MRLLTVTIDDGLHGPADSYCYLYLRSIAKDHSYIDGILSFVRGFTCPGRNPTQPRVREKVMVDRLLTIYRVRVRVRVRKVNQHK